MRFLCLVHLLVVLGTTAAFGGVREWKSAKGDYSLKAELIASNANDVILKRDDGKLLAVRRNELSEADQTYLKSKAAKDEVAESFDSMQTWTSTDGVKIRGKVLAYGRKDYTLVRNRGKVVINGTRFGELNDLHQRLVLRVLSKLESKELKSELELNRWAVSIGGKPKTFTLEGVLMELESGDQLPVPFFMFSEKDLKVLKPGWEAWLKSKEDEQSQQRESLMLQTEANEYQRQIAQSQAEMKQIEYLRLNMLMAARGYIWEVGLQPPPGVYGRRSSVIVTARDSREATQIALSQYPGYQVWAVRRVRR